MGEEAGCAALSSDAGRGLVGMLGSASTQHTQQQVGLLGSGAGSRDGMNGLGRASDWPCSGG